MFPIPHAEKALRTTPAQSYSSRPCRLETYSGLRREHAVLLARSPPTAPDTLQSQSFSPKPLRREFLTQLARSRQASAHSCRAGKCFLGSTASPRHAVDATVCVGHGFSRAV